jgi:hypothetical protein
MHCRCRTRCNGHAAERIHYYRSPTLLPCRWAIVLHTNRNTHIRMAKRRSVTSRRSGASHTRGRAGQSRSGRRLGRLMARNDPAINGRNRICCNNIARFRTTPAAGRRVSRPPVTTSTRARAAKQQIVPTRCGHPGSAISTIRSRRAQPGPLNLHEYRHCAGRRRWPGMRRHGRRPELRRSRLSGARSVATTRATRGARFLVGSIASTRLSSFMRRSVIVWPDPTRTRGVPLHASVRVRSCDANHRWPGATRRRVASFAAIPPYLANMRR